MAGRRGLQAGGVTGLTVADLVPDGRMDVLVVPAGGARLLVNLPRSDWQRLLTAEQVREESLVADG